MSAQPIILDPDNDYVFPPNLPAAAGIWVFVDNVAVNIGRTPTGVTVDIYPHNPVAPEYDEPVASTFAEFPAEQAAAAVDGGAPVGVSGDARAYGSSQVFDSARVYGAAQVYDAARVHGDAHVYGDAQVYGYAEVYGAAHVHGDAHVHVAAEVYGEAYVYGYADVHDIARVYGAAQVYGDADVGGAVHVAGDAHVYGRAKVNGGYIAGEADVSAPHHVQMWRDDTGVLWTVARSRVDEGYEVWKGNLPVTGALPAKVSALASIVTGDN